MQPTFLSLHAPPTESIKYIGSKLKLIPQVLELVKKVNAKTILDGFAGTTRVSQALAKLGYTVICNDVAPWSEVFGRCYLLNTQPREAYQRLIDHLNVVSPVDGWFTEHYGGHTNGGCAIQADGLKKPWQLHNTRKLDAIRQEIEALNLDPVDKAVALTSLMLALDRVDSTLGHFSAYLKDWAPRAYKELVLEVPEVFTSEGAHKVHQSDIFRLVPRVSVDLAYFDPPYGSNNEKMPPSRVRYAAYYHLWKSVVLFDKPTLFGKAKRREDTSDPLAASVFEEFRRNDDGRFIAVEAIAKLIRETHARWILLSYSSGGRATAQQLNEVMQNNGQLLAVLELDYKKNVMAGMKWTDEWINDAETPNREFLFLLEKDVPLI
ncbi:DNA methyltransferase [Candidatus Poribacteria bacterium]|nr:DNA methyltransferase [Candidatus Poribacteria bacterium]MYB00055.1 DNA methyltransferase [Candidatus Poribacteria bacterium]